MYYIIGGYLLLCLGLFLFQKKLVYHPSPESAQAMDPQRRFGPARVRTLTATASDGVILGGWHVWPRDDAVDLAKARRIDLFFCGNAGNRAGRGDKFDRMNVLGMHAVCFDYRGYGDSAGEPSEEGLARDAQAGWDFLIAQGVKPESIIIHGESLGGGVATRLAWELCKEGTPPGGLILEATFTKLSDAGQHHYPFVPVFLLMTQRFPSIDRMPEVTCPLLMFHGPRDEVVPFKLGRRLFESAPATSANGIEKRFVELPSCRHNDIGLVDTALYKSALQAYLASLDALPRK